MMSIFDMCEMWDPKYLETNVFDNLHNDGRIKRDIYEFDGLKEIQKRIFYAYRDLLKAGIAKAWPRVIQQALDWRKPHVVNGW